MLPPCGGNRHRTAMSRSRPKRKRRARAQIQPCARRAWAFSRKLIHWINFDPLKAQGLNRPRHAQGRYAHACPKDHHTIPARRILTRPMKWHGGSLIELELRRIPLPVSPGSTRGLLPHGDSGFRRRCGPSHPKIPAQAGIHISNPWTPACAGVCGKVTPHPRRCAPPSPWGEGPGMRGN